MASHVNIAERLRHMAERHPDKPAVVLCSGPGDKGEGGLATVSHTFRELDRDSDAAARGFLKAGITRGTKTLVMLRPGLPFFSCFFALFKVGAVPVFIDPGMGGTRLLECVRVLAPEAMVGVPLAHAIRRLSRKNFPGFRVAVTHGRRWFWGGYSWEKFRKYSTEPFPIAETDPDEMAAILFTTGSTGPAKGVEYSHGALDRQVAILAEAFGITDSDKDAATFPGFSLFSIALGMTAVIPDMNPVRPGLVNPPNVITPIRREGCTFSFGSPALWSRVSEYAVRNDIHLPTLGRVVMAGAPVPRAVHERLLGPVIGDHADTYTPFGANECMPGACIGGREVLEITGEAAGATIGVPVGYPAAGVRVEIIRIDDQPIPDWDDGLVLPNGEIGEITAQADHASRHYHNLPEADALAKIRDGDRFWHRMGDVGYRDEAGRIWFCGRKAHRVRTASGDLFTIPTEAVFNRHGAVTRSALVGVAAGDGYENPVIIIEVKPGVDVKTQSDTIRRELSALAGENRLTDGIRDILFHDGFPTDIRHNAKINRESLARWASTQLRKK
ncbi:MAG: AMP-binding protein [Planctomycetes bacterium]|nr:AMP-binding protein [Planctomycetota bacterium]